MADRLGHNRAPLIYHSILSADGLARLIEADYALALPVECSLLYSGVNEIYLVVGRDEKYILRVSRVKRYGAFDEGTYRFELDLLGYLRERGFPVSYALARRNNDTLGVVDAPEGRRYYALFNFAAGKAPWPLEREHAYILGEALAKLHAAMDGFSSPHPRYHLDEEFLIHEPLRRLARFPEIPPEDLQFLKRLAESCAERIQGLSRQREAYGIIHGDFWWTNVHLADGVPTLFDFDFCGYGWRAHDIGSLRGSAKGLGLGLSDDVVDSFMLGYESVRKLTEPERAAIPAFEKIRLIWGFGLWTTFVEVMGTQWFYGLFSQMFSNLKKWVEEEGTQG